MKARATIVLAVALAVASGCSRAVGSLPPDSAAPDLVLVAYLGALVAGDCQTARALSTPVARGGVSCDRPRLTSFSNPGEGARPTDGEIVYAIEITTAGGDISLPDGEHPWFYDVLRGPNGVWRVNGGGSGP